MAKRKKQSAPREKWYHRVFDIPERINIRVPFLELNNDRELFVGGYERLICYEDGCVVLLLYDGRELRICGSGFSLRIVREGTLAITGVVTQIAFEPLSNEETHIQSAKTEDADASLAREKENKTGKMITKKMVYGGMQG